MSKSHPSKCSGSIDLYSCSSTSEYDKPCGMHVRWFGSPQMYSEYQTTGNGGG